MKNKLFLFDIDGTLISAGPTARQSMNKAIANYIGQSLDLQIKDLAGLTDRVIVGNALKRVGINNDIEVIDSVLEDYLKIFERAYPNSDKSFVYDDAMKLVDKIVDRNIPLGLLTGNLMRGAEIKLGKFDLMKYFPFGAFAQNGFLRKDLPIYARNTASKLFNTEFEFENIVLVGDTPEDASAAKSNNCKSLIVCRRDEWYNDIVAAGADLIVTSLDDPIIEEKFLS